MSATPENDTTADDSATNKTMSAETELRLSTGTLERVVAEFDFQLTKWYESLPLPVQFPKHTLRLQIQSRLCYDIDTLPAGQ
ncbi:hypothetical protein EMCG_05402 [[Emmonsia] crescens]|uniref:Uncharacterized protein n=1 Tax=[Emmonsia] crescens TaxID=73230 RepID=A0A0G2HQ63_9EURO|nr:hypothetical protein EMCG_05402 [Emmonsia crescens UAMH 3008]